jgi:hypothetical protein
MGKEKKEVLMSLKDEYLVKDVLTNNMVLLGAVTSVVAVAVVFFVFAKGAYIKQAQEFVKPKLEQAKYQIGQVKDITDNNNLLWSLVDSTWKSPDKSKAFVKKLADSQKVPRCGGKACTGDDARLKTTSVSNAQERSITVGWGEGRGGYKYWFKVIYDPKDKFLTIDVNDLLGKSTPDAAEEEAENEETGK